MTKLEEIAVRIIKEQELIMGPIAWTEAKKVPGLTATDTTEVSIQGDPKVVIDGLVGQYARLFGRAAREASREAVAGLVAELASGDIPSSLQAA